MKASPPSRRRGPSPFGVRTRAAAAFAILALAINWAAEARVIHRQQSLYQTILVTERHGHLCMQFETGAVVYDQSCVDRQRPRRLVLSYTRMLLGTLLLVPDPATVLVVGLGGGVLPVAFAELLPDARIDVVEIDPAVVEVAKRFFAFRPAANTRVVVSDARVFTRRAQGLPRRYDLIVLDAFGGDYIPEHLMTLEYFREIGALLTPSGVVAANTFRDSALHDHESETWFQAFGPFINFTADFSLNRILLASPTPYSDREALQQAAEKWHKRLEPYDVPIRTFPDAFDRDHRWDRTKRPLTDQYAPANLLRSGR